MITEETRRESNRQTDRKKMEGHVLRVLQSCELPVTAREIAVQLFHEGIIPYPERSIIQPRVTELMQAGRIVAKNKVNDSVTGRKVATYEIMHGEIK